MKVGDRVEINPGWGTLKPGKALVIDMIPAGIVLSRQLALLYYGDSRPLYQVLVVSVDRIVLRRPNGSFIVCPDADRFRHYVGIC